MIAQELLNPSLLPLKPSDRVANALRWIEEARVGYLPLVDKHHYLGLISEESLLESTSASATVGDIEPHFPEVFTHSDQHIFDVLRLLCQHELDVLAVLDREEKFVGSITSYDATRWFSKVSAVTQAGSVLVLKLKNRDYNLSEIARLAEADNAKILAAYQTPAPSDPEGVEVVLKVNKPEISSLVATYERFGYQVVARYAEIEPTNMDRERLDQLLRYLDI